MFVLKRDGRKQAVHFDKITARLQGCAWGLDQEFVDPVKISQKVCMGVYKGVTTTELDELAAETAAHMTSEHPDYGMLAARIVISSLHKETLKTFSATATVMYNHVQEETQVKAPLLSDDVYQFIMDNAEKIDSCMVYSRDFQFDYFGFKTLERSYLIKCNGKIVERPQHMLMRVACGIHCGDLKSVIESYHLMSNKWFTHATPTLFNAGSRKPQCSSCFLLTMKDDSIEGIYDTLKQCALISKSAGGIGLSVHTIRASGSYIRGTNGVSNGLIPMLRVFNHTARWVNQGGGKRSGSFAIYLEPWHADVMDWLDLRKNHGAEEIRARDLFFGLWVCDLFMKRVEQDADWSLMCPDECPGLCDTHSEEFDKLYVGYEKAGKVKKTIKARQLWHAILEAQIETGTPYMMFKDACNAKSNQKNLGTIRSSNLCTEIVEYTSPDEVAVCNLASIALPKFVKKQEFDFDKLYHVTQVVTKNLNKVIEMNYYPVKEAKNSNFRHRPIGLGVQGLADAFIKMRFPFDSVEARKLNRDIFETIYFSALTASKDLAKELGPYETYEGSPVSQGILQFDMWGVKPSERWDWDGLRKEIAEHGVRNSLLLAPMPTASTSQILGNNECFEPYTSNLYVRRTLAGEFVCVSRHLLMDLIERKLWNPQMKNKLIAENGSVQNIAGIPADIKKLYRTVWEIPGKAIIDMSADRGAFIDQSQSLNVHMIDVNFGKLTSMHFYAWKKGLKTGMYYLRSKAATDAIKFTVDQEMLTATEENSESPETPPSESNSTTGTPVKDVEAWRAKRDKQKAVLACALNAKGNEECVACGS